MKKSIYIKLALAFMLVALITSGLIAVFIRITSADRLFKLRGELEQQVKITSQDEIGELALAFNQMSQEVASANQQRRQMTADIAHDLRTPLTVIAGYVESMRDGVLKPTPERLTVIYTEIERLQQMVTDLRMLSQADAGELHLIHNRLPHACCLNGRLNCSNTMQINRMSNWQSKPKGMYLKSQWTTPV